MVEQLQQECFKGEFIEGGIIGDKVGLISDIARDPGIFVGPWSWGRKILGWGALNLGW